jgi:truncated hemoglobin YjbI
LERGVEYSESNLDALDAELLQAERRRDWMSGVATTLKEQNQPARAAERQFAHFAAMAQAMKELRSKIETNIIAQRGTSAAD